MTATQTKILTDPAVSQNFALYHGDNIEVIRGFADDSIGLTVTSPPFADMYTYNNTPRDIGNCRNSAELIEHFRFLVDEMIRVTMPGRSCCIHLTQTPIFKFQNGYVGREDFRGDVIRLFIDRGWIYASEVLIDKCPQVKAQRTKDRGLLFKSLAGDASLMAPAMADYILVFRKHGENPEPIKAGRSAKYGNPDGWITQDEWIEWAAPVWYRRVGGGKGGLEPCEECDEEFKVVTSARVNDGHPSRFQVTQGTKETNVLNYRIAKDEKDERHLCPLQLDVIERCIKLWSNPGDVVFDPFGGIGSTPYQAVKLRRKGVGIELKQSYYDQAARNCKRAESERHGQTTIFDRIGDEESEA